MDPLKPPTPPTPAEVEADARKLLQACMDARKYVIDGAEKFMEASPNGMVRMYVYALYVALTSIADGLGSILSDEEIRRLHEMSIIFGEKDIEVFQAARAKFPSSARGGDA